MFRLATHISGAGIVFGEVASQTKQEFKLVEDLPRMVESRLSTSLGSRGQHHIPFYLSISVYQGPQVFEPLTIDV